MWNRCRWMGLVGTAALVLSTVGCTGFGGRGGGKARWSRAPITAAELMADGGPSVYESVERLRPYLFVDSQIHARGQMPALPTTVPIVVYINMHRIGGLDVLRSVPSSSVSAIRYVRPSDAMTRFGAGHTGGVIIVELRDKAPR